MTKLMVWAGSAVLAAALSGATAANADDWRRGEFAYDKGEHRFGPDCEYRISARGEAPVDLFGGHHEAHKAEQRSINDWANEARRLFGERYGNWELAQGKDVHCNVRGAEFVCVAAANPCRVHEEHHEHEHEREHDRDRDRR